MNSAFPILVSTNLSSDLPFFPPKSSTPAKNYDPRSGAFCDTKDKFENIQRQKEKWTYISHVIPY